MAGPYAQAAGDYWDAGWRGVLPLPPKMKKPPPDGYTGWDGADPSYPDLMAWVEDQSEGNIALHLPDGVLGIDVDQYDGKIGGETLARWEAQHGPLPATWRTTSRDNVSGIRLFRVPMATRDMPLAWPSEIKPDIQLVHRGHRYMVVPPSVHPQTGRAYRWITPDDVVSTVAPRIGELPELPHAWVMALTEGREAHIHHGARMNDDELRGWLRRHDHGAICPAMERAVDAAVAEMPGGAHDSLRMLMPIVRRAAEGHDGLFAGLRTVREAFLTEVSRRRATKKEAESEWSRSLLGATDKVIGAGLPEEWDSDPCDFGGIDRQPSPPVDDVWTAPSEPAEPANDEPSDDAPDDEQPRVLTPEERHTMAVEREYQQLAIREEAKRRLEAANAPKLEVLGFGEFLTSPEPEPVVPHMFYVDSLSRIFGAPGCGKSFLALDVAFHVALGRDWMSKPVKQGPVVYVMAEGQRVNTLRAKAWLDRHGVDPAELEGKFWAVPDKVLLTEAAARPFVDEVTRLTPALIILDTQNAMQVGEENSGSDTRTMRDALDAMRHATQACVALIGHTGKADQSSGRGSNAAEAAMDTEIKVENDGGKPAHITATVSRDKADEDGTTWEFFLRHHPLEEGRAGAVLVPMSEDIELPEHKREDDLTWKETDGIALPTELLHFEGPGATAMPDLARYMASEASKRANDPHEIGRSRAEATNALKLAGHSKSSVWRAWSALTERGDIDTAEGVKTPHGRHVWSR